MVLPSTGGNKLIHEPTSAPLPPATLHQAESSTKCAVPGSGAAALCQTGARVLLGGLQGMVIRMRRLGFNENYKQ